MGPFPVTNGCKETGSVASRLGQPDVFARWNGWFPVWCLPARTCGVPV